MFDNILKTLLFLSPIIWLPNVEIARIDSIFFFLSSMVLFWVAVFHPHVKKKFPSGTVIVTLAISFVCCAAAGFDNGSMTMLNAIFFLCLDVVVISSACKNPKGIFPWVVYAGLLNCCLALVQMTGWDLVIANNDLGGFMGNAPRLASLLCISLPLAWKVSPVYGIFFILVCFLIKELTIVLCACAILVSMRQWWGIGFIAIPFLFDYTRKEIVKSVMIRWDIWKPIIDDACSRPIFGNGLSKCPADFIFNDYLQFFYSAGASAIAGIVYCLKLVKRWYYVSPLAVLMFFEYPFAIKRIWLVIAFILAIGFTEQEKEYGLCPN